MFGTVLISVCTLMHLYLFWRVASVPFIKRRISRPVLIFICILLWLVLYLGRVYGHNGAGPPARLLEFAGMNWMGILLLTFIPMLALDILTVFGFLFRDIVPRLRGLALLAGILLSAVALFQGMRPPLVVDYEVRLAGLPDELDGMVIAGVSDLHIGSMLDGNWLSARIDQIHALRPDMVVLLGDIFEGHGQTGDKAISAMKRLNAPYGVWGVAGNHEFHGDDITGIQRLEQSGIAMLRNHWVEPRPGLILAGVDDLTAARRSKQNPDGLIANALAGRPPGAAILLSHTPWHADKAARAGAGLMLSGHTHGGQIWPMGYLTRSRYPLLGGRYDVAGMTVIVCRGTGTWGPRMRLWRPGEILKATLRCNIEAVGNRASP